MNSRKITNCWYCLWCLFLFLGITKAAQQQRIEEFPAPNLDGKDGIFFLGNPGNGKSTLINRLIGKEVAVIKKKSIYDDLPSAYIGENNLAYIEVPSSNNWVGPKKYHQSVTRLHTFVQQIKSVKAIVCVCSIATISQTRGNSFLPFIEWVDELFIARDDLTQHIPKDIFWVFTFADDYGAQYKPQTILTRINQMKLAKSELGQTYIGAYGYQWEEKWRETSEYRFMCILDKFDYPGSYTTVENCTLGREEKFIAKQPTAQAVYDRNIFMIYPKDDESSFSIFVEKLASKQGAIQKDSLQWNRYLIHECRFKEELLRALQPKAKVFLEANNNPAIIADNRNRSLKKNHNNLRISGKGKVENKKATSIAFLKKFLLIETQHIFAIYILADCCWKIYKYWGKSAEEEKNQQGLAAYENSIQDKNQQGLAAHENSIQGKNQQGLAAYEKAIQDKNQKSLTSSDSSDDSWPLYFFFFLLLLLICSFIVFLRRRR